MEYTKQELIETLRKFSEELGRTPTFEDLNKREKMPSPITYYRHFGSWNKAIKKAGLEKNPTVERNAKEYSKQELIDYLKKFAEELDRTPSSVDMREKGEHAYETYKNRFGSWENTLKKAGLKSTSTANKRSTKDV